VENQKPNLQNRYKPIITYGRKQSNQTGHGNHRLVAKLTKCIDDVA